MNIYVVTMYKFGDRERHSYVLGVYKKKDKAMKEADLEETNRGGKYRAEILECPIDTTSDINGFKAIVKASPLTRKEILGNLTFID